jgi:hypothetical protein
MKKILHSILLVFLFSIVLIQPIYAAEKIVPGELRHTEFHVVDVPVPKCLPDPIVSLILQVVGKAWPAEEFKNPVFLDRIGIALYDAQFAVLPKWLQDNMTFANKDTEKQPTTVAGRICVYVNGALSDLSEETISKTRFETENTDPKHTVARRSATGVFAALAPLYSITKDEFNRIRETLLVDVDKQLACDVSSPRDTKRDITTSRKGENIFIPGNAKAVRDMLEQICSACPKIGGTPCCPCTTYELYYKGTGLDGWEGVTAGTTGLKNESYFKKVGYEIKPKEKTGGQTTSKLPSALEILHPGELETGGAEVQPMRTELFDDVFTPPSSRYAESYLIHAGIVDNCLIMPSKLTPEYFKGILDDKDGKPLSQNACIRDYRVQTAASSTPPLETLGNTLGKDVPEQKAIDLSKITPVADAPTGACAGNMPATADAFLDYLRKNNILWPNYDNIRAHYADVLNASKKAGIDPGLTMSIWIEESGAGRAGAQFGCTKVDPDFNTQLGCFVNLWNTYANDSRFAECRGADGKLNMKEFMLTYSGGYKDCRSGNFDREPTFPEKIKDWYNKVTNCADGLSF